MTDKTQPLALMLAEQYDYGDPVAHSNTWKAAVCTELRSQHARIAELEARVQELGAMARENRSRRIVELEAQLEAIGAGGVQALSAAPAGWKLVPVEITGEMSDAWQLAFNKQLHKRVNSRGRLKSAAGFKKSCEEVAYVAMLAASPTPPDQQAAPKAAPGEPVESAAKGAIMGAAYDFRDAHISGSINLKRSAHAILEAAVDSALAAPQQEAQGPSKAYAWVYVNKYGVDSIPASKDWCAAMVSGHGGSMFPLYTAPKPAPAPLTPSQYNIALGCATDIPPSRYEVVTRAIERAHGIKGGQHGSTE